MDNEYPQAMTDGGALVAYQRTLDDVVGQLSEQLQRRCNGGK